MARPPKHTPETMRAVKALLAMGMTVRAVGEKLRIPWSTVQWLSKVQAKPEVKRARKRKSPPLPETWQETWSYKTWQDRESTRRK